MANAQKVANIFELASVAFGKLSELTLDLKIFQAQAEQTPSTSSRWTIIEMEQLKDAVARFGNDLSKIATVLETKTKTQIKHKLKTQVLQEGGHEPQEDVRNAEEDEDHDESVEEEMERVHELPVVSTVSVDRGRRKQTFSERSEILSSEAKQRRIEISPKSISVPRPGAVPIISRPAVPGAPIIYKMPLPGRPAAEFSHQRIAPIPAGTSILANKRPANAQDSKYEEYSEDGEEAEEVHYDDDDDDEEESDERYYSEEDQ